MEPLYSARLKRSSFALTLILGPILACANEAAIRPIEAPNTVIGSNPGRDEPGDAPPSVRLARIRAR